MLGTLENLLALAHGDVGIVENPAHSNVVHLRDGTDLWEQFYGLAYEPHWAWCALWNSNIDYRNGTPLPPIDFRYGYIGVDNGRAWFRNHGLLVPHPSPGYLAFYNEHTGRVISSLASDGTFWAIEGNEGDAVRLVRRHLSEIVGGFGVRTYDQPVAPPEEDEDVQKFITNGVGLFLTNGLVKRWVPADEDKKGLLDIGVVKDPTVYKYIGSIFDEIPFQPGGEDPAHKPK